MNEYLIRETGQVVNEESFRALYPNVSLPNVLNAETLNDIGADIVIESPAPEVTIFQTAVRNGAVLNEQNILVYSWTIETWTQAKIDEETAINLAQYKLNCVAEVQMMMDKKALEEGYDDIKSASIRAGYPGPFHDEGVIFATWMDACWSMCYSIQAEVVAGSRVAPTLDELILLMPALVL